MKTNLIDLMSRISQLERDYNEILFELRSQNMNIKIIELDGSYQMLEEYPNFEDKLEECEEIRNKITILKGILFERNNSLKLKNGDTIQKALIDIQNKRKELDLLRVLSKQNPSKRRTSETNNSYFTSKELAYDKVKITEKEQTLLKEIQDTEYEISQLNSIEFEIEL